MNLYNSFILWLTPEYYLVSSNTSLILEYYFFTTYGNICLYIPFLYHQSQDKVYVSCLCIHDISFIFDRDGIMGVGVGPFSRDPLVVFNIFTF
jgi:hypothetical protein